MSFTEQVIQVKHTQKVSPTVLRVFHHETDSDIVLVEHDSASQSLTDVLESKVFGNQTFTLTGDVTGTVTVSRGADISLNVSVTDDSHSHSGATINLGTRNRVVITGADGTTIGVSPVTSTELGYLSGVTSAIQTQLNGKANTSHNHDGVYVKIAFGGTTAPSGQSTGDLWFQDVS